jgi:hypothetical protein
MQIDPLTIGVVTELLTHADSLFLQALSTITLGSLSFRIIWVTVVRDLAESRQAWRRIKVAHEAELNTRVKSKPVV